MLVLVLNGLTWSLLLFVIATGLTIIMGMMRILNFAYGTFYMMGAYLGWMMTLKTGNFGLGILIAVGSIGLMSFVIERGFFRFLPQHLDQVLLSFGFIFILKDVARWAWHGQMGLTPLPSFLNGSVSIGGGMFPVYRLAIIIIGLVFALGLWLLFERTRLGALIRTVIEDRPMVEALGINTTPVLILTFVAGGALAGFAGALGGSFTGAYLGVDDLVIMLALVVMVVGGQGRITGTLAGGLLIGMVDTFGKAFFPQFALFTIATLFTLVMVFKPTGFFGKAE